MVHINAIQSRVVKPADKLDSLVDVSIDGRYRWTRFAQRSVFYSLAGILLFAGLSKAIFWSAWSEAVARLPGWLFPRMLAFSILALEIGIAGAAFFCGPTRGVVYLLRAMGFCFWTASLTLWYFTPDVACPCFFFGDYAKVIAPVGIASLLKAALFLGGAVYLNNISNTESPKFVRKNKQTHQTKTNE